MSNFAEILVIQGTPHEPGDPIPYNRDAEIEAVEAKRKDFRSSDFYVALMAFDAQVSELNKVRQQYEPNAEPLDPRELWIASRPKK